jgi:predicted ATP-dependent protease
MVDGSRTAKEPQLTTGSSPVMPQLVAHQGVGMQDATAWPEIPLHKLRWQCDPESWGFQTTDELAPLDGIIGQERAQKALTLGVEIARAGYNIYVCGMTGTGKLTAVQRLLASRQGNGTAPPDLCYVFQFKNPERPRLLSLPAGQGKVLKKALEELLAALKREIPQGYASESFQQRKKAHLQQAQRREQRLLKRFEARLAPHFGFLWRDADLSLAPELAPVIDGKLTPLTELEERLEAGRFSVEQYKHIRAQHAVLSTDFASEFAEVRRLRHEAQEAVRTLEHSLVRPIIQQAVAEAAAAFPDPAVQQYFQEVEEALNEDIERFHEPLPLAGKESSASGTGPLSGYEDDLFQEYQVNIIVDNTDTAGAPVIFETSPTYKNLFGAIEPALEYGGIWRSDFTGIRAGAIHRANGGYLIFNALDALSEPVVWPMLKRILRYGQAEIQSYDQLTLMPSTTLKPEPIPCDVKVIMIGDAELYEELASEDESFKRLFKVKADFDTIIPRQQHTMAQYASFVRRICQAERLRPFDRYAMAAVVEFGVRLAGRQNKLSARLDVIADVLREADYWAGKTQEATVTRAAVEQALRERVRRVNMVEEKLQELIVEGLLLIATRGAVVGQVNGLSVYQLEEDYIFGCPMRITAETSMGDAGVVNIEREVDLSDATHNKGVLILSGYLRHVYAQDKPLVLSASLCIEQSYEGIVGDSASAAEVYALLSSLAELPVDQGIAVTGSVNQKGELQPISAINEKIEGFFDVCRLQGLTGKQGVMLPPQNIDDLMLRQDVIDAVATGQFHLYAVAHINDGLPILSGIPAGCRQPGQPYPPDSVNGRVDAQLRRFAEQWYALQHGALAGDKTAVRTHTVPKP